VQFYTLPVVVTELQTSSGPNSDRAFIEPPQDFRADILLDLVQEGGTLGAKLETPLTPVGPDVPDGGDVVDGVGAGGLATGSSSATDCSRVSDYQLRFQKQVFGDHCSAATMPQELRSGGE